MDNYIDTRDEKLLENDKYTFFVLKRIMTGNCSLLLSNHESLIICFSGEPYPVWIWTIDDASVDVMEKAYKLAKENSFLVGNYTINMKYEVADYFIKRSADDGINISIKLNMFAYDCINPIKPGVVADGKIYKCQESDIEELVEFLDLFHKEIGIDQKDREGYLIDAREYIKSGNMYLWKNEQGESVASCTFAESGDMASINLVYTKDEFRRNHYAENLVYQVTMEAREAGFVPMLYTNADYVASNACYEKIGYVLRGKLCTVG